MRTTLATLTACCAALVPATPASAAWSEPQTVAAPYASRPAVAVDGHGHAAVAWPSRRRVAGFYRASVTVAVRTAAGRIRTRVLWSSRRAEVTGITVGIDRFGQVIVAWSHWDRTKQTPSAIVRSAFGTLSGRWETPRVVGKASVSGPSLAIAPDGTALLVWDGRFGPRDIQRPAMSWRSPGRRFGAVRRLTSSTRLNYVPEGLQSAFDTAGTAYVWTSCSAVVLRASRQSRRFGAPLTLAPRALGFSLSLSGRARGVASWAGGACSTGVESPQTPGPVLASVLRSGTFGAPVALTDPTEQAFETTAVALPGGRGSLRWMSWDAMSNVTTESGAQLGPDSAFSPGVRFAGSDLVPVAADGHGDQLLRRAGAASTAPEFVLRATDGGADQRAAGAPREATVAVAKPAGRGAAIAWPTTFDNDLYAPRQRLALTVWRP